MKARPSRLIKFLHTLKQPVFLLDGSATMIFCNRALEEWTRCEADKLIGARLRYHTPTSRLKHEIIAASLAPPPEALQGMRLRRLLTIDHITSQSRRAAEFIPLAPEGILVVVDDRETEAGKDVADPPESVERRDVAELHQTLAIFRRRQAGRFRWDRMIGGSQTMQRIRRLGRLAVDSTASVLILGEPGTGREHLASAIHYGPGADLAGALIPIECSVLDEELIVSTIYAFRKRYTQEETGRRHTILLKDAEMLPGSMLAVIADFVAASPSNQRIVATSSLPPEAWTNHESLPILLGTIRIDLPPLRRRKLDIPLLAQLFLEESNAASEIRRAGFTADALDMLVEYDWPGNLAELREIVAEAHGRSESPLVSSAEFPGRIRNVRDAAALSAADDKPIRLEAFLNEIERELIERALRLAGGNKSKAAELLDLTRPKLYRRLEFFGLLGPGHEAESES